MAATKNDIDIMVNAFNEVGKAVNNLATAIVQQFNQGVRAMSPAMQGLADRIFADLRAKDDLLVRRGILALFPEYTAEGLAEDYVLGLVEPMTTRGPREGMWTSWVERKDTSARIELNHPMRELGARPRIDSVNLLRSALAEDKFSNPWFGKENTND